MKKILVLLCLATLTITTYAQDSGFHFGLKAAPSLAWLRTDSKEIEANGSKFGFAYGLITEFNFTERYAFATGLDIAYRGGKLKQVMTTDTSSIVTETTMNLQYIEIPLTLKLKTNEIGYLTYFLQFGFSPGMNIRSRGDFDVTAQENGVTTTSGEDNVDIKDDINNFNINMIIGGGIEYTLSGSTVLLAGVQFNNGFLDISDKDEKVNSNFLALTIGVLF